MRGYDLSRSWANVLRADSKAAPPAVAAAVKVERSVITNMARKD